MAPVRPSVSLLEYPEMRDESNVLPSSRVIRWIADAVLFLGAVGVYFRDGRRVAPLTAAPAGASARAPR